MIITKEIEIDMGHRVPNHKSKCRNLHGHRYKIEVGVDDKIIQTPGAPDEGMVIDFSDIKTILMEEIDARFDHGFVIYQNDVFSSMFESMMEGNEIGFDGDDNQVDQPMKIRLVPFIPTAENLAQHWFELMKPRFNECKIKLRHVRVWETPTSTATYSE